MAKKKIKKPKAAGRSRTSGKPKSRGPKAAKTKKLKVRTKPRAQGRIKTPPVSNKAKKPAPKKKNVRPKIKRPESDKSLPKNLFEGVNKTKIMVVGVGGGGGSIVSEIASRIKKANFAVANTDLQALRKIVKGVRVFQFGQSLTQGLGTGMNSELGRIAAQQEKERIKKLLEGQDLCILITCLGGGAGSGGAPVFAKISKDLGNLTYGIFTLPFEFEGEKKAQIAKDALAKLKPNVNTFSVIPNERIFQIIDKETPLKAALSVINKNLAESLEGLIEMIYDPGLINIDFADLRTIFEGRGRLTYLNTVEVSGPGRTEEAARNLVSSPLYPHTIRGAKGVLFNISGEKDLGLDEISKISKTISDLVNKEAKIIFGISQEKKYHDKIKVTLLAAGCGSGALSGGARRKKMNYPAPSSKGGGRGIPSGKLSRRSHPRAEIRKKEEKKPGVSPKKLQKTQMKRTKKKVKIIPKTKSKTQKKKIEGPGTKKDIAGQTEIKIRTEAKEAVSASLPEEKPEIKIRRNGLQIKKETQEAEQEILNQEKQWETPAFLRRQTGENK